MLDFDLMMACHATARCCYGTAIESFSKLGDSLYFHDDTAGDEQLWIVQYISSVVRWRDAGVNVTQAVRFDYSTDGVSLTTKITIGKLLGLSSTVQKSTAINLRIPGWAAVATSTVELNGQPVVKAGSANTGTFLQIKSSFKPGDVITASFGMEPSFQRINDNRTAYKNVGSIHYGPYALVALSDGDYALKADRNNIKNWLKLSSGTASKKTMQFTATGTDGKTMTLLPLNRVVDQNYSAHLNISADATQCLCGSPDHCVSNFDGTAAGTTSLTWTSDTLVPTGGASVSAFIRSGDPMAVSAAMMQGGFVGKGTINGISLSFNYTVGYNSVVGNGSTISVVFYPSVSGCPQEEPAFTTVWTSAPLVSPEYDKTHAYKPIDVSASDLHLDVSQPGARLGFHFVDNKHNVQILLPVAVKLVWAADEHGHVH
eukprot:COSAG02_NODE_4564_length_5212_cov_1.952297_3_plen_429_part_00